MKRHRNNIRAIAAALVFSTCAAAAMPRTSKEGNGKIVAVDPAAHRFMFQRGDNQRQYLLVWDRHTRFYIRGYSSPATILKTGLTVRVRYKVPLFGPDYAVQVVFLPPVTPAK
jgi:hypothetical protein